MNKANPGAENLNRANLGEREYIFQAGSKSIPYKIVDSARAKYIKLVINADGLHAVKPKRVSVKTVHKFMQDKSEWIVRHYSDHAAAMAKRNAAKWSVGDRIKYLGEKYAVRVSKGNNARATVKFDGHEFEVKLGVGLIHDILNDKAMRDAEDIHGEEAVCCEADVNGRKVMHEAEAVNEAAAEALKAWLVKESGQYFTGRLDYFCKLMGLEFNRVTIRAQKTRWGSCSKKSNLNFNWKLIMAPKWVIDYVIVHEACHLRHMNHSKEFWSMVESYSKDFKTAKTWLRENGAGLGF